jgi:hypothetical protein
LILISSVFNSKVCFLFNLQLPKFFFTIFFQSKSLSSPTHSILAAYLISTTLSGPDNLSAQLARLVVFHLRSIQTPPDIGCRPLPHTVAPLHPPVTPPHGNQEPPHILLSPSKMDATPSSLLPKLEALNNFTHRLTISPPWYHLPSLLHPIKGVGSVTIHCCIHSSPSFGFILCKNLLLPKFVAPRYNR